MLGLKFARTYRDFAKLLGVNPKAIVFYAYTRKGRQKAYRHFSIPKKSGGKRLISAPSRGLYQVQRAILDKILTPDQLKNRNSVFSYTAERGALEMASRHVGREFVVRVDISDFFGAITFPRVLGALKAFPLKLPHRWAVVVAQLCTYRGQLPQGAPTSPAISNMVARRLDGELIRFAKQNGFRYTRYSDDLVFSARTRRRLSLLVERDENFSFVAAKPLRSIVEGNYFTINESKTRVSFRKDKQVVLGNVCNTKLNVDRKYVRQIRTLLYLSGKSRSNASSAYKNWTGSIRDKDICSVIRSKIEYVRQVKGNSDSVFISLTESFNSIFPDKNPVKIVRQKTVGLAEVYANKVFVCQSYHEKYEAPSDDSDEATLYKTGSCFFLEGVGLVTAFHNLFHLFEIFQYRKTELNFRISNFLYQDPDLDIAILDGSEVFKGIYQEMKPEEIWPIGPGTSVSIAGFPFYNDGDEISIKQGKIVQEKMRFGHKVFVVDIDIQEGESGAPVLNDRNRVIGVVRSQHNESFIVPISYYLEAVSRISGVEEIKSLNGKFVGFSARRASIRINSPFLAAKLRLVFAFRKVGKYFEWLSRWSS